MRTYTTVSGDTWDVIAKKVYGDEKKVQEIMEANTDYLDVVIFSAGITLNVPEIEQTSTSEYLPPWKRVK